MRPTGFNHVALPVPDVEASAGWYCRVFDGTVETRIGWSEEDVAAGRTRQVFIRIGEAIVNLAEGPSVVTAESSHFFHYAFTGSPADLERWIDHLRSEGVEPLGPYGHGRAGGLSIYFDDPNGYRLELLFDLGDYEEARSRGLALGGLRGNPANPYPWT